MSGGNSWREIRVAETETLARTIPLGAILNQNKDLGGNIQATVQNDMNAKWLLE